MQPTVFLEAPLELEAEAVAKPLPAQEGIPGNAGNACARAAPSRGCRMGELAENGNH
jgi:hypothetical protein